MSMMLTGRKSKNCFAKECQWMTAQMQMHIREVKSMFADERKKVRERYKELLLSGKTFLSKIN